MAITTIDTLIAGMQPSNSFLKVGSTMEAVGVLHSRFYDAGMPGAAAAPSPGINGAALTTYAGQLPFTNPVSGNTYLAHLSANTNVAGGTLILCDRLWHNSGINITTTTLQAITSGALPARDRTGTTNGVDVRAALEVSGVLGNGVVTNTTLVYTSASGVAGRTATIPSFNSSAQPGTFIPFALQAGDTGIRSMVGGAEGLTLGTSYVSGTMHLVLYRELAQVNLMTSNIGATIDAITSGFPRMYNNTVPFFVWLPSSVTANTVSGRFVVTQG